MQGTNYFDSGALKFLERKVLLCNLATFRKLAYPLSDFVRIGCKGPGQTLSWAHQCKTVSVWRSVVFLLTSNRETLAPNRKLIWCSCVESFALASNVQTVGLCVQCAYLLVHHIHTNICKPTCFSLSSVAYSCAV
ncbi:unnamed protein product [Ixodes hexagonus]